MVDAPAYATPYSGSAGVVGRHRLKMLLRAQRGGSAKAGCVLFYAAQRRSCALKFIDAGAAGARRRASAIYGAPESI